MCQISPADSTAEIFLYIIYNALACRAQAGAGRCNGNRVESVDVMVRRRGFFCIAGVLLGIGLSPGTSQARVFFGFGVPVVPAPWYYVPPPVIYAPPPVIYPPPVVVAPPAPPAYGQTWYYCDNPRGYYPAVQNCPTGWRAVPAPAAPPPPPPPPGGPPPPGNME
jgi:hypothetical protein